MGNKILFSYHDFIEANDNVKVSRFDYLRSIYKVAELPTDFLLCFARLFSPEYIIVGGKVIVMELFDPNNFEDLLNKGHSVSSAQFWTNLIEITGLFDELTTSNALELAEIIVNMWNIKLIKEFGTIVDEARVIHDSDSEEIFIVIGTAECNP